MTVQKKETPETPQSLWQDIVRNFYGADTYDTSPSWNYIQECIHKGADMSMTDEHNRSLLHFIHSGVDEKTWRLMIEKGAALEQRLTGEDEEKDTPLLYAARSHSSAAVTVLAECGADVHAVDSQGYTALRLVVDNCCGNLAWDGDTAIRALLKCGADPAIVYADGKTVLDIMRKKGFQYPKLVKEIEEAVTKKDIADGMPLRSAVKSVAPMQFKGPRS